MQAVLSFRIEQPFAEAEASVRSALQSEGFGILTEVDVQAVLKSKLGVEVSPQKLLGACNPNLAHAALQAEPSVGAFLPCGLSLRAGPDAGVTFADLQNPELISESFDAPGLEKPARAAAAGLTRALAAVGVPI